MEASTVERDEARQAETSQHIHDALKRAGLSVDVKGYKQSQLARAKDADLSLSPERLRTHIMGNGNGGQSTGKPRAKYNDRVHAVRESAMKYADGGKAIVPPITPVQVQRVLRAMPDDPYADGGPLDGLTKKDAGAVARDGGRDVSTRSVGDWKKRHKSLAKEPNRKIVAIAFAAAKVGA